MAQKSGAKSIDKNIEKAVRRFSKLCRQKYNADAVILFGSYAKGNARPESDIDIAVVSSVWTDTYDAMAELMGLTWETDARIEPHPIKKLDFDAESDFFIKEIKTYGVLVAW